MVNNLVLNRQKVTFLESPQVIIASAQYDGFAMEMRSQVVTPLLAEFWLDKYHYDDQRNIRKSNLELLVTEMANGRFLPNSMLVFWKDDRGDLLLIDGQHRLSSVVKSGNAQHFWIQTITGDPKKLGIFYSVIDIGSPRSTNDGFDAMHVELPQSWLRQGSIVAAVRKIAEGFSHTYTRETPPVIAARLHEWYDAIDLYGNAVKGGSFAGVMRGSRIMAAGLIVARYQPALAEQFLNGISYDDGLLQDDPRKMLVKQLADSASIVRTLGARHESRSGRLLAYIWNKYYQGKPASRMPNLDTFQSIVFEGTPYNTALPNNGLT